MKKLLFGLALLLSASVSSSIAATPSPEWIYCDGVWTWDGNANQVLHVVGSTVHIWDYCGGTYTYVGAQ